MTTKKDRSLSAPDSISEVPETYLLVLEVTTTEDPKTWNFLELFEVASEDFKLIAVLPTRKG